MYYKLREFEKEELDKKDKETLELELTRQIKELYKRETRKVQEELWYDMDHRTTKTLSKLDYELSKEKSKTWYITTTVPITCSTTTT